MYLIYVSESLSYCYSNSTMKYYGIYNIIYYLRSTQSSYSDVIVKIIQYNTRIICTRSNIRKVFFVYNRFYKEPQNIRKLFCIDFSLRLCIYVHNNKGYIRRSTSTFYHCAIVWSFCEINGCYLLEYYYNA